MTVAATSTARPDPRGSTPSPGASGNGCALSPPLRIGRCDWESQNIRWTAGRPLAVHDWDSVIAQPETAVVGLAAAVWSAAGAPGEAASIEQTQDFIAG